eukprot:157202_1
MLTIRLKRYHINPQTGLYEKNNKKVTFPNYFNFNSFVYLNNGVFTGINDKYPHYPLDGPYKYVLKYVIIHSGDGNIQQFGAVNRPHKAGGHYVCFVRLQNGSFICNDDWIRQPPNNYYQYMFGDSGDGS